MKYFFNNFELDTRLFELRYKDQPIPLEPQVYSMLAYLITHRDRIISKQELLDSLWEGRIVTESSLNTCIKAVRKALNDNGQEQHTIATIHRRGYRFIANTEEIPDQQHNNSAINTIMADAHSDSNRFDDQLSPIVTPFTHSPDDLEAAWWSEIFSEDISIHCKVEWGVAAGTENLFASNFEQLEMVAIWNQNNIP